MILTKKHQTETKLGFIDLKLKFVMFAFAGSKFTKTFHQGLSLNPLPKLENLEQVVHSYASSYEIVVF